MKYYHRENYLKKIRGFYHDTSMIKVITGIRRCGKSCLMYTIMEELAENGIDEDQVIYLDLDKRGFKNIKTPDALEALIDNMSIPGKTKYLFIDEIQNVQNFEELLNGYRGEGDYSIFITGSNSYLLSGEMITKLTGRYLEFEIFPLTFEEYLEMKGFLKQKTKTLLEEFDEYILHGGFPHTLHYQNMDEKRIYVKNIINEIFEKDIRRRAKIKNREVFNQVQSYIINNFGSLISITNIHNDLKGFGINIKRETLERYIQILIDAKIICPCNKFDLKSRKSINGGKKYYLADLSFFFATNTDNRLSYGPVLENIIYIYARSKGYSVSIGRIGDLECDFILRDIENNYAYVQSAMTIMSSKETEEREYRVFEKIKDNYPKYLLTRNDILQKRDGIKHFNAPPFIKNGQLF